MAFKQRGTASRGPAFATRSQEAAKEIDWEELRQIQGKVTAIESQVKDPDRRSLYVDGRFVLGLHGEILYMASLRVGDQIDGPRLVELLERELEKRCWDDALHFLARAPHAKREVERKLARRWPEELITRVLARLERGGWLDDAAFARAYMEGHPGYGPRRLLGDLVRKGVDRELAERVLAELTEVATERRAAFDPQVELSLGRPAVGDPETVRILALKKLNSVAGLDRVAAERRLGGFLLRRGFGMEEVRGVLRELLDGFPPPEPRLRKGWGRRATSEDHAGLAPQEGARRRRATSEDHAGLAPQEGTRRRRATSEDHAGLAPQEGARRRKAGSHVSPEEDVD